MDIYHESLQFHKKKGGKIVILPKVALKTKSDLALSYTPGVAEVSRVIGKDEKLARDYTIKKNTVAVISDGSAILGLGNLGASAAIPVMEGKAALFKKFAGIDAFPICIQTQNVSEFTATVKNISPVFGGINLEDISAPRCFEIEERLKRDLDIPVMHDDQHGTAVVVLAGIINSLKMSGKNKKNARVIINGAGAAGIAIAKMLLKYGFTKVSLRDSKGSIYEGRTDLNKNKEEVARLGSLPCKDGKCSKNGGDLACCISKADIFIGVSKGNLLTAKMIKTMRPKPIIFALANPVPEIMPGIAKSAGAFIIATGRSDFPNQVNNVLAFPGIFRGALNNNVRKISRKMLFSAAQNLAGCVKIPRREKILPSVFDPKVVKEVARAIK